MKAGSGAAMPDKEDIATENQMASATRTAQVGKGGADAAAGEGTSQPEASTSSPADSEREDLCVDAAVAKEEAAARAARERAAARAKPAQELSEEKLQKLDALLDKATMYSQFLVEQVNSVQDQWDTPDDEDVAVGGKRKKGAAASGSKRRKAEGGAGAKSRTKALVPLIEGELRDYQLRGVSWLISLWTNGMNGILADQMGLGKTVQTVAFLSHLRQNGINGPFLIVVPLSTIVNWQKEVARWCPSMRAIIFHGTKADRQAIEKEWFRPEYSRSPPADFPVIVTSFEIAIRERKALSKLAYKYMVVDEGHRLKNANCLLVRELKRLTAENKLLLTGTPLQNNLAELWSLLNFLLPAVFNNLEDFESWFDFSGMVASDAANTDSASHEILQSEAKNRMVSKLHEILKPFLLRRVKADVEQSLPLKQEIVLYAPLTAAQRKVQESIVARTLTTDMATLAKANNISGVNMQKLNNMLMQLRKNCNHPDIITADYDQTATYPPADDLVAQAGKMQLLERLLTRLKPRGHKVLIFSQFTKVLDLMDAYLDERGHRTCRIDGAVGYQERMAAMDAFNGDPDCFVFLLSTRAGGLGINLTSADTVVIYDSDWNPHQDMQAMDRAHRIGQTKPVLVLRLCTSDSVEVKLLRRANSKLALERLVIKKGAFQGEPDGGAAGNNSLSAQDLLEVLKGDMRLEGDAQNSTVDDKTLDMLLDRTHLAKKIACPYPASGPGYELVAQQSAGLLSSVQ